MKILRSRIVSRKALSTWCLAASFAVAWLYAAIAAGADGGTRIDAVFELLQAREAVAERYAWDFDLVGLKRPPPDLSGAKGPEDLKKVLRTAIAAGLKDVKEESPYRTTGSVLYDVETGRFRLEVESINKWVNGAAPANAKRAGWAFDGTIFTGWNRQRHGTELPPRDFNPDQASDTALGPPFGEIKAGAFEKDTVSAYFRCSGLSFLPPFVHSFDAPERPVRFTDYLRQKQTAGDFLGVDELPGGLWTIRCRHPNADPRQVDLLRITIDPTRGGVITAISLQSAEDWPPSEEINIRPREWKAGIWGPEVITYFNWLNGFGSRRTWSRLEVDPPVKEDEFRIAMPPGTTVTDHVRGMSYMVSRSSVDEAKAVREYIRTYKLGKLPPSDVDDDNALPGRSTSLFVILLSANGVVVAGVVLLYCLRRRKRRGLLSTFLAGAIFSSPALCGAGTVEADHESVQYQGGWHIRSGSGEKVRISQCGYNVALLALSLFDTNFDPMLVDRELKPAADGIRMSALKGVLEAHGLTVSGRAEAPLPELARLLSRGQLAILAVRSTSSANLHYVAICRAPDGDVLLLDPPGRFDVLSRWTNAQLEKYGRMTALICSRDSTEAPLFTHLTLSPDAVVLDAAADAQQDSIAVHVLLQDTADRPLAITGVSTPCGCIRLDWRGGVIPARGKSTVEINVLKSRWGIGPQAKAIEFMFADGTSARLPIEGELISAKTAASISSGTRVIRVPMECGKSHFRRMEWIDLEKADPAAPMTGISSSEPWCMASVTEQSGARGIQLDVALERTRLEQLANGVPLRAQIRSEKRFAGDEISAVDWNVSIYRDIAACITPRVMVLKDGAGICKLELASGVSEEWRPTAIVCTDHDLQFEWTPAGTRCWEVRCMRKDDKSQPVTAKCVLEKSGELPTYVTFVVMPPSPAKKRGG